MQPADRIQMRSEGPGPGKPLSARQLECLYWVQEGKSAYDIGRILGISGRTVENHMAQACAVLGVRRWLQAVLRAREQGLIGPAPPSAAPPHRSFRPR